MEEAHKLECATCRHVPRNPNIYLGFYPLPEKPHWSHNKIFDRCSVGFFLEPDFGTAVVAPAGGPPVSYARHLVNEFPDRFEAPRAA